MNENLNEEFYYYKPGDTVVLKHKELHSPVMLIKDKVSRQFKMGNGEVGNIFCGMKCIWFDKNDVLQEAIFSTKDLQLYNK